MRAYLDHNATSSLRPSAKAAMLAAMEVTGNGQVFLANQGMDIQVMYLENDAVFCNGASVLAYRVSGTPRFMGIVASGFSSTIYEGLTLDPSLPALFVNDGNTVPFYRID